MIMNVLYFISGQISRLGVFMFLFALFYFSIKYTVCRLLLLNKHIIINKVYLDDLVSLGISLLLIISFFTIRSPYMI